LRSSTPCWLVGFLCLIFWMCTQGLLCSSPFVVRSSASNLPETARFDERRSGKWCFSENFAPKKFGCKISPFCPSQPLKISLTPGKTTLIILFAHPQQLIKGHSHFGQSFSSLFETLGYSLFQTFRDVEIRIESRRRKTIQTMCFKCSTWQNAPFK
jgi:hypothetical protein